MGLDDRANATGVRASTADEALGLLERAVASGTPVLTVTAAPPVQTRALVRLLGQRLGPAVRVIGLRAPFGGPRGLQRELCETLGLNPASADPSAVAVALRERDGETAGVLLTIADAHRMGAAGLQYLSLLHQLARASGGRCHLLLAGEPGLETVLANSGLAALQDSAGLKVRLAPAPEPQEAEPAAARPAPEPELSPVTGSGEEPRPQLARASTRQSIGLARPALAVAMLAAVAAVLVRQIPTPQPRPPQPTPPRVAAAIPALQSVRPSAQPPPLVAMTAAPPAVVAPSPAETPRIFLPVGPDTRIVVRFAPAVKTAEARRTQVVEALRRAGLAVARVEAASLPKGQAVRIAYFFPQDRGRAEAVQRALDPVGTAGGPNLMPPASIVPAPGTVEIAVAS